MYQLLNIRNSNPWTVANSRLLIALYVVLLCQVTSAQGPCLEGASTTHPISEQRSSGTFEVSKVICEQDGPEFFIQDFEVLRDINSDVREYFCHQFNDTTSNTGVCSSGGRYNFIEHPERMNQFIEIMGTTLQTKINIPENFTGSSMNTQNIRAMMYLCTEYNLEKYSNLIASGSSEAEKRRAIESLEHIGLLGHYLSSRNGRAFLTNPSIPIAFRSEALRLFLNSSNSTDERISYFANFYMDNKESQNEGRREYANILGFSFNEYLEQNPNTLRLQTLAIFNQTGVEGAQEAISARGQASAAAQTLIRSGRSIASVTDTSGPSLTRPNCSEVEDLSAQGYASIIDPLNNFLEDKSSQQNSGFIEPGQTINTWNWYRESFSSDKNWAQIEIDIVSKNPSALSQIRAFYCFVEDINSNFEIYKGLSQANSSRTTLANQLFDQITSVGAQDNFLSIIGQLFEDLSETNKLSAIDIIDRQVTNATTEESESLRFWRRRRLSEIVENNTNDLNGLIVSRAVSAIANNGSEDEEEILATYFQRFNNDEFRRHIIAQYANPRLIQSVGSNMQLLNVLSTVNPMEKRQEYISLLLRRISKINISNGSYRNNAIDESTVNSTTLMGVLTSLSRLSSGSGLQEQIEAQIESIQERAAGVNDSRPSNDRGDVTIKPDPIRVGGGGGIGPSGGGQGGSIGSGSQITDITQRPTTSNGSIRTSKDSNLRFDERGINLAQGATEAQNIKGKISQLEETVRVANQESSSNVEEERTVNRPNITRPENNILGSEQNNFFSSLAQGFGLPETNNSITPIFPSAGSVGEKAGSSSTSSFEDESFRNIPQTAGAPSSSDKISEDENDSTNKSNNLDNELLKEVRKVSEDTTNLRNEIDKLDDPIIPPTGLGPGSTIAQATTSQDRSPVRENNSLTAAPFNGPPVPQTGRGPASSSRSSASPSEAPANNGNGPENIRNSLNEGILSPFENPTEQDLSKVIKVQSLEEKNLLMNYMAANEEMTCPELRFIQDFYEKNIDNFILSKRRKPWREYALLELEGINFRFNYPGATTMRQEIKQTCATLAGKEIIEVGEDTRAPASSDELIPEEARPAQEESGMIKKFMLRLGL
ncbi:MAG: hypothetical protein K9K67_06525 [Bacteriovoracaceae bacterium]|nr:hypothetical protein [Bacteriovoracaceae bacterium]